MRMGHSVSCVIMRRAEWGANSYSIGQLITLRLCSKKRAGCSRENAHCGLAFFGGGRRSWKQTMITRIHPR